MAEVTKPRLVGLNHIALEVGDIEEALAFYYKIFSFELRGKSTAHAFIDIGDQFIALMKRHIRIRISIDISAWSSTIDPEYESLRPQRVQSCLKEISSISSTPGAIA